MNVKNPRGVGETNRKVAKLAPLVVPHSDPSQADDHFDDVEKSKNQKVVLDGIQIPVHTNVAAGVPVLELIKRYEDENILTRADRLTFYESLKDPARRDKLIRALNEVEVGANPRFAIQRLKAYIHQNPGGLPNGKMNLPQVLVNRQNDQNPQLLRRDMDSPRDGQNTANVGSMLLTGRDINAQSGQTSGRTVTTDNCAYSKASSIYSAPVTSLPHEVPHQLKPLVRGQSTTANSSNTNTTNTPGSILPNIRKSKKSPEKKRSHMASESQRNRNSDDSSINSAVKADITEAISEIVGPSPKYRNSYNICHKLEQRLMEFLIKYPLKTRRRRTLGVIIGSGSCNPLTRMHMRRFFLAKQYLESRSDIYILGSFISPVHHTIVRERYRNHLSEIMPSPHRLAIAQMLVAESKWLTVDPWEVTRKCSMDYLSVLEHLREVVLNHSSNLISHGKQIINLRDFDIKIFYLCKPSIIPMLSPIAMRRNNFNCLCVCRAPEGDYLKHSLSAKWNGVMSVIEDDAILDCSIDMISSKDVRAKIKSYCSVAQLMGGVADEYLIAHDIAAKVRTQDLMNFNQFVSYSFMFCNR